MASYDQTQDPSAHTQQQPTFDASQYQPIDHVSHMNHQQQQQQQPAQPQPPDGSPSVSTTTAKGKQRRSSPIPRIRRACIQCHSGKTKCSDSLPCQSCIKRGLTNVCVYADPDNDPPPNGQQQQQQQPTPSSTSKLTAGQVQVTSTQPSYVPAVPSQQAGGGAPASGQTPQAPGAYYYDYQASNSSFRAAKRPRPLTEDETAAITKNFQRGAFYIGSSMPIRIDPRLPVRLTLGEGDQVHFEITGEVQ